MKTFTGIRRFVVVANLLIALINIGMAAVYVRRILGGDLRLDVAVFMVSSGIGGIVPLLMIIWFNRTWNRLRASIAMQILADHDWRGGDR